MAATVTVNREEIGELFSALHRRNYLTVGPTIRDGAIVYDRLASPEDLPVGWTDEQEAGTYRLSRRNDDALFGYVVGPQSFKKFLFPSTLTMLTLEMTAGEIRIVNSHQDPPNYAFIGVRPCELAAIEVEDRVLGHGEFQDPTYLGRRRNAFLVAVNCIEPGGTCFCSSMNTGPRASSGFDLAVTELLDSESHRFLVEAGSERGSEVLEDVPHTPATPREIATAQELLAAAGSRMGRSIDTGPARGLLLSHLDDPCWEEIGDRCLACSNCTMVCPTCFCVTVTDSQSLDGASAQRIRTWDSCFSTEFSYIHGGSLRDSTGAKYRQWITHKLATWFDQFGMAGCVGCGRCITWCPVGIDITKLAGLTNEEREYAVT